MRKYMFSPAVLYSVHKLCSICASVWVGFRHRKLMHRNNVVRLGRAED